MAKAKFWVIEGVNEVIKGYYTAGKGKTAAIESIDGKVFCHCHINDISVYEQQKAVFIF